MGVKVPAEEFRASPELQSYICPICVAASSYKLIHLVLARHEIMSKQEDADSNTLRDDATDAPITEEDAQVHSVSHLSSITTDSTESQTRAASTESQQPRAVPALPHENFRVRTSTAINSFDTGFRAVVSQGELRRKKRCKGMLFGLKHMNKNVETLLVLDSNGRSIKAEDIDGDGDKVCLQQIGGLCVAATTSALKECTNLKYPKIKNIVYGLGTNDHLHSHEHPGERIDYLKELNLATKKVFTNARIHFILPFSAIEGLGGEYVHNLSMSIRDADVGWKIHHPPSMRGKLVKPNFIHLNPLGRVNFTQWLRRVFAPRPPTVPVTNVSAPATAVLPTTVPPIYSSQPSYSAATTGVARNSVADGRANQLVSRDSGESNSLDSLLKERLFELLLGSHGSHGQVMNRQRCCNNY